MVVSIILYSIKFVIILSTNTKHMTATPPGGQFGKRIPDHTFSLAPDQKKSKPGFDEDSTIALFATESHDEMKREAFQPIIPLPPSDYDLTDLDSWRVAGSLGMMESEIVASEIERRIIYLTTKWSLIVNADSTVLSSELRNHNLRVLTDKMLALLQDTSKAMLNLTRRGILTKWLEATVAITKARDIVRNQ